MGQMKSHLNEDPVRAKYIKWAFFVVSLNSPVMKSHEAGRTMKAAIVSGDSSLL